MNIPPNKSIYPQAYCQFCKYDVLLQGNLPIADVAYKVGFANQSHLNHHFQQLLGVTPKAIAGG
ncbi:AraC family transcriptional regulator [Calothrix sp. FACHB-156]|nr:AraC family transcriptional regulator [Nostoc linckia FACHB-104]MBD2340248.1 AraC family transcriptional regulator [Calothrix sp. FACHB-156]